ELASLPLFIWMGEILFRSRLSEDMFEGLAPWLGRLPGRLFHVNIVGSGIFAAVSGSSAATAATIGKMSIPELARRGYDERMSIGSLAGAGTLGLIIPPSIVLIVYGVAIEESIARLFVAGILPGIMLIGLFMGFVAVWALFHPAKVPSAPAGARHGHHHRGERVDRSRHRLADRRGGGRRAARPGACGGRRHPRPGHLRRRAHGRDPDVVHDRLHPGRSGVSRGGHGLR